MWTVSIICITQTFLAVIKCWKEYWPNTKIGITFEDLLCCERMIITSNSSMISSNDKMRTSKILSHYSMMNCLLRSCISHLGMKSHKHDSIFWIILFYKRFICWENYFVFKITKLFFANQRTYK